MYDSWLTLTQELVDLKAKITIATGPIYKKIFEISELKARISHLSSLDTKSGMVQTYHSEEEREFYAFMDEVGRDTAIEELEDKIDLLQSEIDIFNTTTTI